METAARIRGGGAELAKGVGEHLSNLGPSACQTARHVGLTKLARQRAVEHLCALGGRDFPPPPVHVVRR